MAVVALGAFIRLVQLGSPAQVYFDETYYANDARVYLRGVDAYEHPLDFDPERPPVLPPPFQGVRGEKSWVHPPLGKWLIAAGEALVGPESPWGWRLAPAVAGVATVGLVYLLGLELLGGAPWWAALAALLAALDGLLIVQSRISMLDSLLAAFVCAGAWCLLKDRRRVVSAAPDERRPWYGTPWRIGAGTALAAAVSTKWSGALALLAAALLLVMWSASQGRLREEGAGIAVALVAIPALVYLMSYAGWFLQHGFSPGAFFSLQRRIADYHAGLDAAHPYESSALTWLVLRRPVAYYYQEDGDTVRHILALGNPGLWWAFIPAFAGLAWLATRRACWEARTVLALILFQYVPWLLVARALFLFYMTPVVPFMALTVTMAARALPGRAGAAAAAVVGVGAVAGLAFLAPLWIGYGVDRTWWRQLMLFGSWI